MRPTLTVRIILQLIGFVYFIAFTSFGIQAQGLIGSGGILPFAEYLRGFAGQPGVIWELPTLLWLNQSDAALHAVWILGALASLAAIFAPAKWQRVALAACFVLWLSLCVAGQDFLSYQWDVLLLEAGFLAIFADDSPMRIWLFRWLAFRLMFFSGAVKLLSHDPNWRNLTALHYHYETQPLPNPIAWYADQLPLWFQKASTLFTVASELAAPFLFFAPRRFRHIGGWIMVGLQLLILFTGNYTFFNILAIILALFLFLEPKRQVHSEAHRRLSIALASIVGLISGLLLLQLFGVRPPGANVALNLMEPFRIVNSYGLFAVMTTERPEIVVEGSNDGSNWLAYEFPYKAGDVRRAPPFVAPHQPRLDWQMWFAALEHYQENRWFINLMARLLRGEPSVLRLMKYNPFPNSPPKYIRARLYLYHFTRHWQKDWWTREERGLYFPVVSLKQ